MARSYAIAMVASEYRRHGLTVVTRDPGPFERVGVPWLDPWSA
ncbi:MAG TPA: hypothetical protein VFG75_07345 [Gaiella sp.]|nr:hypothetical protein [Gaiella sp.]